MKKKAFTLIEILVIVVIVFIAGTITFSVFNSVKGIGETSYGRNLQQLSIDRTSYPTKYHFKDIDSGEKFWSYDKNAETLIYAE